jgi:uncharacterized membrane protein YfcA
MMSGTAVWPLLFGAGMLAGAMNAMAGGGSFVSLPAMIAAGVPSLNANASSTLALVPGALASAVAYRKDFRPFSELSLTALYATSLTGGLLGALLLIFTPQRAFDTALPWLLLFGSATFAFGRQAGGWLRERVTIGPVFSLTIQFVLGIYGGYFGGAMGIMVMAVWALLGSSDFHAMNASRVLLVGATNVVASIVFIIGGLIVWPQALTMLVGAISGGYGAAWLTRRLDPRTARLVAICINFTMTALFFWRAFA